MSASNRAVCRVVNGNSCGSGTIVGHWQGGSLVLTNSHVAGSTVGRVVRVEIESLGMRKFNGTVIRAAYSSSVSADWAIIHVEGFQDIKPVYLSKSLPDDGEQLWSKGFPACKAFAGQMISQHKTLNNGVLLWTPDARPGQSGSSVVDLDEQVVVALLTWSWGDGRRMYGAGQLSAEIYKQNRSAQIRGYAKMPGLIELPGDFDFADVDRAGLDDPIVEEGFFSIPIERGIQDLPIWFEDQDQPPPPGDDAIRKAAIEGFRRVEETAIAERKKLESVVSKPIDPTDDAALGDTFGL